MLVSFLKKSNEIITSISHGTLYNQYGASLQKVQKVQKVVTEVFADFAVFVGEGGIGGQ